MKDGRVRITCTPEQAYTIARCVELVARLHTGQFREIIHEITGWKYPKEEQDIDIVMASEQAEQLKKTLMPHLMAGQQDRLEGSSAVMYEIYKWLRHGLWRMRGSEADPHTVDAQGPLKLTKQPRVYITKHQVWQKGAKKR